ncbi:hypothetical protein QO259_05550 [Salinicola sp. JS01]|uniref:phage regulatory CII family protein n=1 Tax=Salinicola sp. JS01 TaxID=3050071 RepID=UPI00255B714C|nr:phage regulatory CII family protein [Salinicola sp. JS01]WIX34127.1 hypothetical protein QO259_05550 [Salinicola sp. JS01]
MGKQWPTSRDRAATEVLPLSLSLYHAARDYPGGIKAVAAVHGLNPTTLQHKLSPTHEPHRPNIDDLEAVLSVTLDDRILDSLGEIAGGAIWVRPQEATQQVPELGMLGALKQLHREVAETVETLSDSLDDQVIDIVEAKKLDLRIRRLLGAVLAVEKAAEQYEGDE